MSGQGRQMDIFGGARAPLVAFAACITIWASGAHDLLAGPIAQPAGLTAAIPAAFEPFRVSRIDVFAGPLKDKWSELARKLDDERVQLALCDGDRERCVSPAALRFLAIVDQARARDGRARLGEINRAINLALRPVSDLAQYGEMDVWSSPLNTFDRGAGDCEDYAIAKYAALLQAGLAAADLRIVLFRDTLRGEDHAVAAARLDGHWLLLDNQRMAMIEDVDAQHVHPLFVIDETGIGKYGDVPLFTHAQADMAPTAIATAD
jgi:predicted transglutaminase-like cysteine proteinase